MIPRDGQQYQFLAPQMSGRQIKYTNLSEATSILLETQGNTRWTHTFASSHNFKKQESKFGGGYLFLNKE